MAEKTPHRTVRVSDELWEAAKAAAAEEGLTVTDVVVAGLRTFVEDHADKHQAGDAGNG